MSRAARAAIWQPLVPRSRWLGAKKHSYSLHLSRSKQPIGTNQQDDDHQEERGYHIEAVAQKTEMTLITCSQLLGQANDDSADHGSGNRIQPAQNDRRK